MSNTASTAVATATATDISISGLPSDRPQPDGALTLDGDAAIDIGENLSLAFADDLATDLATPADLGTPDITLPAMTDSARLLAAGESGADPFDVLDPTAATAGEDDDGSGRFVLLPRISEATSPLSLAWGRPGRLDADLSRAGSAGGGDGDAGPAVTTPPGIPPPPRLRQPPPTARRFFSTTSGKRWKTTRPPAMC